jgi:RHS repeat-associated protein
VRHLFTGQQWYSQIGLYDLRNRFYSPDLGRFLQPDPIGFRGGNNLYRYCGNNPVTTSDPFGLQVGPPTNADPGGPTLEPVNVNWPEAPTFVENPGWPVDLTPLFPGLGGPIPTDGGGPGGSSASKGGTSGHGTSASNNSSTNPQQPPPQTPPQPSIDPFHATTTAEFIAIGNMIEHGDTTDTTPAIDPIDFLSGGIAALARTSVRSVVQKAAVFWAGGRVAEDAARTFAKTNGGTVIADTAAGRALAQSTVNIQARGQWLSLSQDFARNASGEVNVFQNARGVPLDTIWRNEYEILMENPNVTGIKYWVVMPDGSVVPAP